VVNKIDPLVLSSPESCRYRKSDQHSTEVQLLAHCTCFEVAKIDALPGDESRVGF
jgi:hypothetical protein